MAARRISVFVGDGKDELCEVIESFGFVHDIGMYAKEVRRPDGTIAKAVGRGRAWRLWTWRDRLSGGRASQIS